MFPRAKRLTRAAFNLASASAKRVSSQHFSISFPTSGTGYAVVVSKAVAPSSVARHKLKRRVLESLKRCTLTPSLIVYAKKGSPRLTFQEIKSELEALLTQVR